MLKQHSKTSINSDAGASGSIDVENLLEAAALRERILKEQREYRNQKKQDEKELIPPLSTDLNGVIETIEPTRLFAFRWQANPGEPSMTLVEFTLEPDAEGTRLRVVESGFASLPPHLRTRESHVEGWQRELRELAEYLAEA